SFTLNSNTTVISACCAPFVFPSSLTANVNNIDAVANRWLVSALLKGGWLADPQDLLYLIGGWTYGAFEAIPSSDGIDGVFQGELKATQRFGLNGITVGAGFERQFASMWSLKGEYRFTQFQSKTIDYPAGYVNSPAPSAVNSGATTNSSRFS